MPALLHDGQARDRELKIPEIHVMGRYDWLTPAEDFGGVVSRAVESKIFSGGYGGLRQTLRCSLSPPFLPRVPWKAYAKRVSPHVQLKLLLLKSFSATPASMPAR